MSRQRPAQPGNAGVGTRGCDEGPAIGVSNEDRRALDPRQCAFRCGNVACQRVEAILGRDHLVPLRLQRGDDLPKGRAVGPNPMDEQDARFALGHTFSCLLLQQLGRAKQGSTIACSAQAARASSQTVTVRRRWLLVSLVFAMLLLLS